MRGRGEGVNEKGCFRVGPDNFDEDDYLIVHDGLQLIDHHLNQQPIYDESSNVVCNAVQYFHELTKIGYFL